MAHHPTRLVSLGIVILILLLAPLALGSSGINVLSQMMVFALFALAFSLLAGQAGMLSFGHTAFFAIGSFATVHAMQLIENGSLWLPTPLLPIVGGLAGLLLALVAGYFATLSTGVYFAMITLAVAELLHIVAPSLDTLFGGEAGLSSMRMPWAGISFGSAFEVYYLVLFWVVVSAVALYLYTLTPFGRLTVALRESERRVAFLGYNVHKTKLLVFVVSGLFAGVAGSLLAIMTESANYVLFGLEYSADVVLYSYIGGITSFFGPAIGAGAMVFFNNAFSDTTRLWLLYQGLLFVFVMMYMPTGVVAEACVAYEQFKSRGARFRMFFWGEVVAVVVASSCFVFLCETLSVVLSRDYKAELARTGVWAPVKVFAVNWQPDSILMWLLPVALLGAAVGLISTFHSRRVLADQGGAA